MIWARMRMRRIIRLWKGEVSSYRFVCAYDQIAAGGLGVFPVIGGLLAGGGLVILALLLLVLLPLLLLGVLQLLLKVVTLQIGLFQYAQSLPDGWRRLGQTSQHNGDLILTETALGRCLLHKVVQLSLHTIAVGLDNPDWNVAGTGNKVGRQIVLDVRQVV